MSSEPLGVRHKLEPRFSVIIPTHNRAADIDRCLNSLAAQTFNAFEVLVCDDGSTDNTAEIVDRHRESLDLSYHWAENFGGPARPRNVGLRQARAEYVAFLDSDDWWAPRKLERCLTAVEAGADVIYHKMYSVYSLHQKFFWRKRHTRRLGRPVFKDLLRNGNAICTSSIVLRRDLLARIGGFSEDRSLIAWEDFDAWLRIAKNTERFTLIDEALGFYWAGGGNISTPRRVVATLESFKDRYVTPDCDSGGAAAPAWYYYCLGCAYSQLGLCSLALEQLRQALSAGLPFVQRSKALVLIAMLSLRNAGEAARMRASGGS